MRKDKKKTVFSRKPHNWIPIIIHKTIYFHIKKNMYILLIPNYFPKKYHPWSNTHNTTQLTNATHYAVRHHYAAYRSTIQWRLQDIRVRSSLVGCERSAAVITGASCYLRLFLLPCLGACKTGDVVFQIFVFLCRKVILLLMVH